MFHSTVKKIMIATLLGGLTLFVWGAFSHLVLFKGDGFTPLPAEDQLIGLLKTKVPERGLYFFPGKDFNNSTKEQDALFDSRFRSGPVGLLLYRPVGGDPFAPKKLIIQLFSNLLSVFIAVLMAALTATGFWKRVMLITALGLLACSSISTIYWNWYEFPSRFFVAQVLDVVIGFFLAGLVICCVLKNSPSYVLKN